MKYVLLLYQVILLKTWRLHKKISENNWKSKYFYINYFWFNLVFFFFIGEFQPMAFASDIVFYHQTKTPIDFWCRQRLNPKSLIQFVGCNRWVFMLYFYFVLWVYEINWGCFKLPICFVLKKKWIRRFLWVEIAKNVQIFVTIIIIIFFFNLVRNSNILNPPRAQTRKPMDWGGITLPCKSGGENY